ncbi:MAG: hypothetical protein K9N46_05000 [Candidatus Marinimicrobia bacterium]|nr:hypothetical protein [Candidatus Neomarinimicrobiota bacterium]MCF7829523.1 hypothetical protein [Candidatus Neomarinimicrobiota bacterium]MCF7880079.1 hypothetical protein [Candidatus Neomarinimicrobiota bacterium]
MKTLLTLLNREWLEWRNVVYIFLGVFVALLLLSTFGSFRLAHYIDTGELMTYSEGDSTTLELSKSWGAEERDEQVKKGNAVNLLEEMQQDPVQILQIWTHVVRGGMVLINLLVLSLAIFYLSDAVYKERADGSTFYYRSLPVSDVTVLVSKVLFGYVGVLVLSYLLTICVSLYLPMLMPYPIKEVLAEHSLSLSQIKLGSLYFDWGMFHILQFFWLLPVAMYFMFISVWVKGRPLLIGIGGIILAAIVWQIIFGRIDVPNQIVVNFGIFTDVMKEQWVTVPDSLNPGEPAELFGSFSGYIFSMRTLISLAIAGLFGYGTFIMYRRNIEVT